MIHMTSTNHHSLALTTESYAHLDVGVLEVGVQPLGRHHGLRPGQRVDAGGLGHRGRRRRRRRGVAPRRDPDRSRQRRRPAPGPTGALRRADRPPDPTLHAREPRTTSDWGRTEAAAKRRGFTTARGVAVAKRRRRSSSSRGGRRVSLGRREARVRRWFGRAAPRSAPAAARERREAAMDG